MPTVLPSPNPLARLRRWALYCPIILPFFSVGTLAATPLRADLTPAWEAGASFFAEQSLAAFTAAGGAEADGPREARLGRAGMLLTANPVTAGRRDEAVALLTALADEPMPDDDWHHAARYLLGRVAQIFVEPTDAATAAHHYEQLITEAPSSRWAQLALSRHALGLLFTPAGPADPADRIAAVKTLLTLAESDATRRNLHLTLARAHLVTTGLAAAEALPHLKAALALGGLDYATQGDTLSQIIILLNLEGRRAETVPYLEEFVRDQYRDRRRFLFEQELAAVKADPALPTLLPLPPRR